VFIDVSTSNQTDFGLSWFLAATKMKYESNFVHFITMVATTSSTDAEGPHDAFYQLRQQK